MKKIWRIFLRDLKVNSRDFISIYILIFPFLFAIGINLLTPSINDTTVNLALVEGENPEQIAYFENFAKIELFKDEEAVTERIMKRDNIVGILSDEGEYYILQQGDEDESVVDLANLLLSLYEVDSPIEDTNTELHEFGRSVPPLKKMLVNIALLFTSVLAGMMITLNIVEEKADRTIRAIHLSPVSRNAFIIGKGLMGVVLSLIGSAGIIIITGFNSVNLGQMLLMILSISLISFVLGFLQGVQNSDVIEALASVKLLFLPLAIGPLVIELLAEKWHKFFYWNPFFWAYKGIDEVLAQSASWPQVLLYVGIIVAISAVVYIAVKPKIKKGLL